MMKFRTEYRFTGTYPAIGYHGSVYATGSCFTDHMVRHFRRYGFRAQANSHGIVYNPLSLADGLEELIAGKAYTPTDLEHHEGRWFSLRHHGAFAGTDPEQCLLRINTSLFRHREFLAKASHLFITFGSAWAYRYKPSGNLVANCHKLPGELFDKVLLDPANILIKWLNILDELKKFNPSCSVIFTVSPVKHLRDGVHENQLGKASLLLAIHQLREQHPGLFYFPAYELVTDDLRDYRYYDRDMAHPNELALDYVWERLSEVFFDTGTRETLAAVESYRRLEDHRPAAGQEDAHREVVAGAREALENKYPYLLLHPTTEIV